MAKNQEIGKKGEDLAAVYLKNLGYEIIATNWRYSYYEIDLIAKDGNIIVVVEVKSRSTNQFANPETSVDNKKRSKLIKAAEAYIFNNNYMGELRFDIVSIIFGAKEPKIYHIKDAFYPKLF